MTVNGLAMCISGIKSNPQSNLHGANSFIQNFNFKPNRQRRIGVADTEN